MNRESFVTYPAILYYDIPGDVGITFPDFSGCTGQCKSDTDILAYAQETLGFYLSDYEDPLPEPTKVQDIHIEQNAAIMPVRIYLPFYRETLYSKAVNRTVTLPYWLDKEAKKAGLNFSHELQFVLMQKIGAHKTQPV